MADFIMSIADRAQILVAVDEEVPNAGLTYQLIDNSNADITPGGLLTPKRPGPVLINVFDVDGNLVKEMIGVIRAKSRFQYDRSLQTGARRVTFLVNGLDSGINLTGAITQGSDSIQSGGLPPAVVPPVYQVRVTRLNDTTARVTWKSVRSDDAPYRVDFVRPNGTVAKQSIVGVQGGVLHTHDVDISDLVIGEYLVQAIDLSTNSYSAAWPFSLDELEAPNTFGVTLFFDPPDRFIVGWSSNDVNQVDYVIEILDGQGNVVFSTTSTQQGSSPFYAIIDAGPLGVGEFAVRVSHPDGETTPGSTSTPAFVAGDPTGGENLAAPDQASGSAPNPGNAFDGDELTSYLAADPAFLRQELDEPTQIRSIEFVQLQGSDTVLVSYSNDGINWTTIPQTFTIDPTPGVFSVIDLPPVGDHAFWEVAPANLNPGDPWEVSEMALYETLAIGFGTQPYGYGPYGE